MARRKTIREVASEVGQELRGGIRQAGQFASRRFRPPQSVRGVPPLAFAVVRTPAPLQRQQQRRRRAVKRSRRR